MQVCEESLTNKTSRYVIQHFVFLLFLGRGIRREARAINRIESMANAVSRWRRSV